MRRRLITIGAALIVLFGLLVGIYLYVTRDTAVLTVPENPFEGIGSGLVGSDELIEAESGAGEELAPGLVRISNRPVAEGVVAINRISTTTETVQNASGTPVLQEVRVVDTEVRFIDRASGNIYQYMAKERSLRRLSNKTLPGVQQASWLSDGTIAYARFLTGTAGAEQVATYVLPENGEGGFFLEQGLSQAEATRAGSLFTLLAGTTGSVGSISQKDGTGARTLFTSLISTLVVHPTSGNYFAHTKGSAFLDGYAFQINTTTGGFTRVLGPLRGLSVLPNPAGTRLLYTYLDRGTLRLAVYDIQTRQATALPVTTMTEKCTWAPDGLSAYCGVPTSLPPGLPDFWYQGAVTFSDRLWQIDMEARLANLIVDPLTIADVPVDAVAIHTDPEEDVLLFTDRSTGELWIYDL